MKINPNKHLPQNIAEDIDEGLYGHYAYYDDYYDDWYSQSCYAYDYDQDIWNTYAYVESLDKILYNPTIKGFGDYNTDDYYEDEEGNLHHSAYVFSHKHKITAFMGCVYEAMKQVKQPSQKLQNLHKKLTELYPEIILKLI